MGYHIINGEKYSEEGYNDYMRQQEQARQRAQEETARLVKELSEAYKACSAFMEQNPELCMQVADAEAREHELYEKLRRNLERADESPRCEKVKEDGTMCGSPQMTGYKYCYAHERMAQARARKLELPALEDANAIQMAVMMVQRALIDDEISEKKAGLLLYSLQLAASNVEKTTFGQEEDQYLVTEAPEEMVAVEGRKRGETSTTETRRRGEEGFRDKTLPRMNTGDTDSMSANDGAGQEALGYIDRSTARRHSGVASLRSR